MDNWSGDVEQGRAEIKVTKNQEAYHVEFRKIRGTVDAESVSAVLIESGHADKMAEGGGWYPGKFIIQVIIGIIQGIFG